MPPLLVRLLVRLLSLLVAPKLMLRRQLARLQVLRRLPMAVLPTQLARPLPLPLPPTAAPSQMPRRLLVLRRVRQSLLLVATLSKRPQLLHEVLLPTAAQLLKLLPQLLPRPLALVLRRRQ